MGLCGAKGTRALTLANSAHPMWAWSGASAVCGGHLPGGATAPLLLGRPVPAAVWLGRKVSGTEVSFHGELTVGPLPHSPALHTPTGTH